MNDQRVRPNTVRFGHTTVKGVFWTVVQKGGTQFVTLLTTAVLARLLSVEDFGQVALIASLLAIAQALVEQGVGVAIVQRKELERGHLNSVFWLNMACSLVFALLGVFCAGGIAGFFGNASLKPLIAVISCMLPLSALNMVQLSLLQKKMQFRAIALQNLMGTLCGAAVGVSMAFAGMGAWSLVAQTYGFFLGSIPIVWLSSSWRPNIEFSWRHLKEILSFSLYFLCSGFLHIFNTRIDQLFIGYFLGTAALGVYDIAGRLLLNAYNLLSQVVGTVFFPMFSLLEVGEKFCEWMWKSLRLTALVCVPMFVGLSLVAADVIPLLYGEKWADGIPVMQLLSYLYIAYVITRVTNSGIAAAGYPQYILWLHLISTVCHVLVMYLAVQVSLKWVAGAYTARVFVLWPMYLLALRKATGFGLKSFLSAVYPSLFATTMMFVAVFFMNRTLNIQSLPSLYSLTAIILGGCCAYFVALISILPRDLLQCIKMGFEHCKKR